MNNLLVITQKVDINDNNLGFFHIWLNKLAGKVDKLTVICLEKGVYNLPNNVEVLSLGKEKNVQYKQSFYSKFLYLGKFYSFIWRKRKNYHAILVHMNPEYCILGGLLWRLTRKKILLWYTHKAVNWRLRLGAMFANKIFTASKESFRLNTKKVEVVGHGIPVEKFASRMIVNNQIVNIKPLCDGGLYLFSVGRITPSKDWETIAKGLAGLKSRNIVPSLTLDVAGGPITKDDFVYLKKLHTLYGSIAFKVFPPCEMPSQYKKHHIFVHTSRTGSMDKVVLEALASGRIVVTSSEAYADLAKEGLVYSFREGDYQDLISVIEKIWESGIIIPNEKAIEYVRKNHNLDVLISKIMAYFSV